MIELYGGVSPNAAKIYLMLEELGLFYNLHNVKVMQGEQYSPEFLALNPLGKYPVIIDHDGAGPEQPIFESGAILIYLAETYGSYFLPSAGPERWEALKWLMVQTSWVGPMLGQHIHFRIQPSEAGSYAASRYHNMALRVCEVLNSRLRNNEWLAGKLYTIADIATFPWINTDMELRFDWADYPELMAWRDRVHERPATARALATLAGIMKTFSQDGPRSEEDVNRFFLRDGGPAINYGVLGFTS